MNGLRTPRSSPGLEKPRVETTRRVFVARHQQMDTALAHLSAREDKAPGRSLVIRGDSGTGKTYFLQNLLHRAGEEEPQGLYLYIDIANDEYQSAQALVSLVKTCLVPGAMTDTSVISVPESATLARYRRQKRARRLGLRLFGAATRAAATFFGAGGAVGAAFDGDSNAAQLEDEFVRYLSWVARKRTVVVAIDNVQFLNLDVRLTVESMMQRVGKNVRFVVVERTIGGGPVLAPPVRCFSDNCCEVSVRRFTLAETTELVAAVRGDSSPQTTELADDIYTKTGGLAKDIEYCLMQYSRELGKGAEVGAVEGLLATIDRLPLIHRQFLVVATLLDGGVDLEIARNTVRRLTTVRDEAALGVTVEELVAREYLRLNGESGERLQRGHERITMAVTDLGDEDLQEEVRQSLIEELTHTLEDSHDPDKEPYALHCLVGIQTAPELSRNLHYISRLIQTQYRHDQFSYLVAISAELQEVLPMLPEHVLDELLDAMQKNSSFDQGLLLVRQLDAANVPGRSSRRIHRMKYLTQSYRYEEALALSEKVEAGEWREVYRVNALLALDRYDEAREIADYFKSDRLSEAQAVMRRNTIVLFDSVRALSDLDEARVFFEQEDSRFRLATVETNRSLVFLKLARYGDAQRSLQRAVRQMTSIESGEVFQAQLNCAVLSALLGDFESALERLAEASLHVPRALLLDQVKIEMNRCVIKCAAGDLDSGECAESLERCREQIRGLQMPYLQQAITDNLAVAGGDGQKGGSARQSEISVDIELPDPPGPGGLWTLLMAIHWRY